MKNSQKGFVVPLLVAIIAVLAIGGGVYVYETKKVETPAPIDLQVEQSDQTQQPTVQNNPVNPPVKNTPVSPKTNTSSWKKYSDASISFEYPSLVSIKQDAGTITLSHSVAYRHPNPCDFKGDAPPLDRLGDFGVSLKVVNQNLKEFVQSSTYPGWDYASQNPFAFGSLNGFKVSSGVEGCGEDIYYLTISSTQTLVIHRGYVAEFNSINGDYQTYLNLPGIISPNKAEEYFNHILSTLKFISPPSNNSSAKISPDFLPDGYVNPPNQQIDSTYYNQKLTASGFLRPGLKWEVVSGSLPSGFYLSKNSISCIPENPCDPNYETWQAVLGGRTQSTGVYTFTVRASSGSQSVDKTYTITVKNSPTQSSIYIIQPVINETWQIGTPHPIRWKLNTDQSALRGSLFLTVFLQDSSGNLINAQAGQQIQKDQNSTTISIPYFANPAIMPGNYHLVFNIFDTIAALPCVGCQGYSKLVASATTTATITLTASDGKVAPAITSLSVTNGRVGDSISVNGVAFQNDSKIIFERLNPLDGQARIKISLTPQIVSSNKLTFTIPNSCTNSDVCNPQNSLVTSGVYYVSVQTQYGTSNVSGIQVSN